MKFRFFKSNKRVYLNKYFFICLTVLLLFLVYAGNYTLNNDTWFLINHGRYVFNHGIPKIEPFTLHNGFSFVMQQWLSALIFYLFYRFFGIKSLLLLCVLINYVFFFIFYKVCMCLSNNNYKISFIVSIFVDFLLLSLNFMVLRPQIFTFCLVMLLIFCLEKYIRENNIKYLLLLPVISFLQINLHASMWWMLYVFMLPYLLDGFNFKKIKAEHYRKIPIVITMIVMFLTALINPYGIEAIKYFINSYGVKEINGLVLEMKPFSFKMMSGKFIFAFMMIIFICYIFSNKDRLRVRYLLFLFGPLYLGFSSVKGLSYFFILSIFPLAFFYKDKFRIVKFKEVYSSKIKIIFSLVVVTFIILFSVLYKTNGLNYTNKMSKAVDFLLDNYDKNKMKLYVGYDQGGYFEYRGLKPYIDPRAEVFLKANNKKEDIFKEYYDLLFGLLLDKDDLDKFLEKYNFTHLVVVDSERLYNRINENGKYEVVFKGKTNEGMGYKIYVRKDLKKEDVNK
ncbi:MAG: hypothetical protein VZS44_06105 [Bacilli bacterium]|nr:hypothetical protein [Bacilli bacterium]